MSFESGERLLLAESDAQEAFDYRAAIDEFLDAYRRLAEAHHAVGEELPGDSVKAIVSAERELKRVNRICMHHAARMGDRDSLALGRKTDVESAVIHFDLANPL